MRPAAVLLLLGGCADTRPAPGPELSDRSEACRPDLQDCDDGLKCAPGPVDTSPDAPRFSPSTWPELPLAPGRCHAVLGDLQAWQACARTPETGEDDCAPGLWCMPSTNVVEVGRCVPLCSSGEDHCGHVGHPELRCFGTRGGFAGLCFADCDPSADACQQDGTSCQRLWDHPRDGYAFGCLPSGDAALGESCGRRRCETGLDCYPADIWSSPRCTIWCDPADGADACPDGAPCQPRIYADGDLDRREEGYCAFDFEGPGG